MATLDVADLSPEQREIWQAEQEYWATAQKRDVEGLLTLVHHRITVWPHFAPAPMDSLQVRKDARIRVERDLAAYELSFHAITVYGDAAIVYYTVTTTSSTIPPEQSRACITHTWIRDRDAWRLAGGMSRSAG